MLCKQGRGRCLLTSLARCRRFGVATRLARAKKSKSLSGGVEVSASKARRLSALQGDGQRHRYIVMHCRWRQTALAWCARRPRSRYPRPRGM
jgi:hypothetical protein